MNTSCSDESEFLASYTAKDCILYALSIGFGSSLERYTQDLRFVHEEHPNFTAVPTFCLALLFWAKERSENHGLVVGCSTTLDLPSFPPPMMQSMGVLPNRFLRDKNVQVQDYPILHTYQSITFQNDMPVPGGRGGGQAIRTVLQGRFVSVVPKSVGTFVTTETTICCEQNDSTKIPLCTVQSTALILGLSSDLVKPYQTQSSIPSQRPTMPRRSQSINRRELLVEEDCTIAPNQALLYRLASGDSNAIHVDPSVVPLVADDENGDTAGGPRPLLHGLCTLGIAARVILQTIQNDPLLLSMRLLEGTFVKPVFVGDPVLVQAWKVFDEDSSSNKASVDGLFSIQFVVRNQKTGESVLDKGRMLLVPTDTKARSRL